jgi:uncharacterized protein (TIGR03437 family)
MARVIRRAMIALWVAVAGAQTAPEINTTSAPSILEGRGDLTVVIDGTGFAPGIVARWNSTPLATTWLSATRATAVIPGALTPKGGRGNLSLANSDGAASQPFPIPVGPPFPGITHVSPEVVAAGGGGFTLTVDGVNFLPRTDLLWNNASLLTGASVSATRATFQIPAALAAAPGVFPVWLTTEDADRNGASSNRAVVRVALPVPSTTPVIESFSATPAYVYGPDVTLTVNGRNFDRAAALRWNGNFGLTTTWISPTQLQAVVPSAMLPWCCQAEFSVSNLQQGEESESARMPVEPAPAATLLLSPSLGSGVNGSLSLTVRGYGFGPDAAVRWNGTVVATTDVDRSRLTATVPAGLLFPPTPGRVSVTTGGYTTGWQPFTLTGPKIAAGGVVNAASSLPAIAPGSLISIYGSDFAPGTYSASGTPLPLSLGGTSVTINGVAAPLLFVSPTQINAQAPYEIGPGRASLIVQAGNFYSPAEPLGVNGFGPGVYTMPLTDHAVAVNLSDGSLNSAAHPAGPGEYVILYLTGQGAVAPRVDTGDPAPSSILSLPAAPVTATLGGVPAKVAFAGLAPGFVSVLQVNLEVPGVDAGEHLLEVAVGGVKSNRTTVSVKPR